MDLFRIAQLIDELMQPGNFFIAPNLAVQWIAARSETIAWEVFRGRLIDPLQTREKQSFLSWHLLQKGADEPVLSIKLDVHGRRVYATRGLLCHVWEAYDADGRIQSCEVIRWTRELVGTIPLDEFADPSDFSDEVSHLIGQTVVGTSRLPLHSVEAPLPAFTLGQLHYVRQPKSPESRPFALLTDLLQHGLHASLTWREWVKVLEFVLRHSEPGEVPAFVKTFVDRWLALGHGKDDLPRLWRSLFNDVSLSPYTGFVDNALAGVDALVAAGDLSSEQRIDFLSYLLRQLDRHLTAYDLVTFHHRGANYPDALLLDAVLKQYLNLIDREPEQFLAESARHRRRRRALRQGLLLRRHYEGHLVPDLPTSPGENARVLPPPYTRVPEEQLLQPLRRNRRLFTELPTLELGIGEAKQVFAKSLADLDFHDEQKELGKALFIDRPLGYSKAVGEPDQTPLFTHEVYSPSVARRKLAEIVCLAGELTLPWHHVNWKEETALGVPLSLVAQPDRPTASLADARRVADDFVVVRTLSAGLAELWQAFDLPPLDVVVAVQIADAKDGRVLAIFDAAYRCRGRFVVDASEGCFHRGGVELPVAGLIAEDGARFPAHQRRAVGMSLTPNH